MMRKVTKEEIRNVIWNLEEDPRLELWNEVADSTGSLSFIHEMSEFDDVFYGVPPYDIANIVIDSYNQFNRYDEVFTYDEYNNELESFGDAIEAIDLNKLVDEIYDAQQTFMCMDLVMLFDSVEAECMETEKALLNRRAG